MLLQLLLEMDLKQHICLWPPPLVRKVGCPVVELPLSDVPFASYTTVTLSDAPPGGWGGSKYSKTQKAGEHCACCGAELSHLHQAVRRRDKL